MRCEFLFSSFFSVSSHVPVNILCSAGNSEFRMFCVCVCVCQCVSVCVCVWGCGKFGISNEVCLCVCLCVCLSVLGGGVAGNGGFRMRFCNLWQFAART